MVCSEAVSNEDVASSKIKISGFLYKALAMAMVKERAEENKTFFKLNSNEEKEKKMAEKENISTQQTLKQDKPRGFRR